MKFGEYLNKNSINESKFEDLPIDINEADTRYEALMKASNGKWNMLE